MGRSALYRDPTRIRSTRAEVTLAWSELTLEYHDGRSRWIDLDGSATDVGDAAFRNRFVRMLTLERRGETVALITPPEAGAIAPRVAFLPSVPEDAAVVDDGPWQVVVDWVRSGGRLSRLTIAELANLATIAASSFAMVIGEAAAQIADALGRSQSGPLRGGAAARETLSPLERAARRSPRAAEALMAALAWRA